MKMLKLARLQQDKRTSKYYPTRTIVQAVMRQVLSETKSVHALEAHVDPSDQTVLRILEDLDLERLSNTVSGCIVNNLRQQGKLTTNLPSGKAVRLGSIDGTECGGHWFGAFAFLGSATFPVGLEEYGCLGKERSATCLLLNQFAPECSHMLADGLYLEENYFEECLQHDCHGVVKYTPKEGSCVPNLIKKAKATGAKAQVQAYDKEREQNYQLIKKEIEYWGKQFTVVLRRNWNDDQTWQDGEESYIITTDQSLTCEDLYSLSYSRWAIENNVFKTLNDKVGHKYSYIKNEQTKKALLYLQLLGLVFYYLFALVNNAQAYEQGHFKQLVKAWIQKQETIRGPPDLT